MNERINYVTSEMEKTADDVRASFGSLSGEQLNWKPAEKSWSVGQCLEHIIKTNEMFRDDFNKLASGSRRNSLWENWSPFTGFNGRFLIKSVTVDSKKSKVPSKTIIPPSEIGPDIVERFCEHVASVNELLDKCAGADLKKTVMSSPFLSVFTYTLDDGCTVLVEHTKRHIRQAKRAMEAYGFPKAASVSGNAVG